MLKWVLVVLLVGCKAPAKEPPRVSEGSSTVAPTQTSAPPLEGQRLELWVGGIEAGQAAHRDDGNRITSEVTLRGKTETIEVSRAPRKAKFGAKEVDVPADTLPWGTGHVALARLAQEWFPDAKARPIKLMLPRTSVDATVTVTSSSVEIAPASGTSIVITFDGNRVTHATTGGPKPGLEATHVPDGIVDEPVAVEHDGIVTRGVLWMPKGAAAKLPLLIIHAGSGPSDRDCNQMNAMFTSSFRMLAEALAGKQIATLRFDKRFSGQTSPVGRNWTKDDVTRLRIDDYVTDLSALIMFARKDPRFGPITVMGHSEGGLISVLAATRLGAAAPDALLFVNSLGRKYSVTIREQLAAKVDAKMIAEYDALLAQLRANKPATIPAWLEPSGLVTADTLDYFRSEMDLDPGELLGKLKIPATVVQGETDMQTSIDDANHLVARRPDVKVTRLPKTNHVLKEVPQRTTDMASYLDPTLPLAPGVVDAVVSGIKR